MTSSHEQRTIEHFFQDHGVESSELKAKLLPLLTETIYEYNQNVIAYEKSADAYRKSQIERSLCEIQAKITKTIVAEAKEMGITITKQAPTCS